MNAALFRSVIVALTMWSCALLGPMPTDGSQKNIEVERICHQINQSYGPRQSQVCVSESSYDFFVAGHRWRFDRRDYQQRLRMRLGPWFLDHGLALEQIRDGQLEVWFGTHVFDPERPLLRIQFLSEWTNLMIDLPFQPAEWAQEISRVQLLDKGKYPTQTGVVAGQLLVELGAAYTARDIGREIWLSHGLELKEADAGSTMFIAATPFLRESAARTSLLNAWQEMPQIKRVLFVPAGEVGGEFVKAFTINMLP